MANIAKSYDDLDFSKCKYMIENAKTNFYPLLFAALGGQSGGNSILFAKALSEVRCRAPRLRMRWQPTRGWRQVCKSIFQEGISFGDLRAPLAPLRQGLGIAATQRMALMKGSIWEL